MTPATPCPIGACARPVIVGLLVLITLAAASCSRFEPRWRSALREAPTERTAHPVGAWSGAWISEGTAHTGELRCVVEELEAGSFIARFHATWGPSLPFEYAMEFRLDDTPTSSAYRRAMLRADLGWPWGEYTCQAEFTPAGFRGEYRTAVDRGAFDLRRVTPRE